jgi:hypothetical protein
MQREVKHRRRGFLYKQSGYRIHPKPSSYP